MGTSKDTFKNAIDKAYTTQPNVKLNSSTMGDALKYKSGFTEEVDEDGNKYETFLNKSKKLKKGKSETKEATGSGSSGAYSGPVFGEGGDNDEFWEKSRSETPGLKKSDVEKVFYVLMFYFHICVEAFPINELNIMTPMFPKELVEFG